jgi:hypothetical protein
VKLTEAVSLRRLYDNADYSDLTITSPTKSFSVHKAIVCPRSEYFATECRKPESQVSSHRQQIALSLQVSKGVHLLISIRGCAGYQQRHLEAFRRSSGDPDGH